MAKVVSPLHSQEARGSVGDYTYSTVRGASVVRTRSGPSVQYSTRQVALRAATAQATALWKTLTASQRALWDAYASTHLVPDWAGSDLRLSGYNWFVRVNCLLADSDNSLVTVPPPDGLSITAPELTVTSTSTQLTVAPDLSGGGIGATALCDIWLTDRLSPAKSATRKDARHKVYQMLPGPYISTPSGAGSAVTIFARWLDPATGLHSPWTRSYAILEAVPGRLLCRLQSADPPNGWISGAHADLGGYTDDSDPVGAVCIDDVPAGTYDLYITAGGFYPYQQSGVSIAEGTDTDLGTIQMQVEV